MKTTLVTRTALAAAAIALAAAACGAKDDGSANAESTATASGGVAAPSTSETGAASATPPGQATSSPGSDTSMVTNGTAAPEAGDPSANSTTPRCHTADLSATIVPQGAAAGNRYATLVLNNKSTHACRIFGYGGVQLLDANHRPIATKQSRSPIHKPTSFVVKPNGHASTVLHWGAVPDGSEPVTEQCEPTPAMLSVIPPDETTALVAQWQGGPVCEHGLIDEWAYAPGVVSPS